MVTWVVVVDRGHRRVVYEHDGLLAALWRCVVETLRDNVATLHRRPAA